MKDKHDIDAYIIAQSIKNSIIHIKLYVKDHKSLFYGYYKMEYWINHGAFVFEIDCIKHEDDKEENYKELKMIGHSFMEYLNKYKYEIADESISKLGLYQEEGATDEI